MTPPKKPSKKTISFGRPDLDEGLRQEILEIVPDWQRDKEGDLNWLTTISN